MSCILEANESSKEYRKNWAQLIQKIYEVDLLTWPKCSGKMKVFTVIPSSPFLPSAHLFSHEFTPTTS